MSTESKKQRPERVQPTVTRPPEHEPLPCPRCDSNNTKFCYYNNYNLSQPRHFCKSCRRYWTRGGTLRNVPFGGGTRKSSNKRLPFATNSPSTSTYNPIPTNPVFGSASFSGEMNLNEPLAGGFTSLLSTQQDALGFVSLNGFGLGLGSALQGFGFGLGTWDWPLEQVGEGTTNGGNRGSLSGTSSGCDTWPIGGVEAELSDGDCLGWPDLAISTPSDALK